MNFDEATKPPDSPASDTSEIASDGEDWTKKPDFWDLMFHRNTMPQDRDAVEGR